MKTDHPNPTALKQLLTRHEAAHCLALSLRTIDDLVKRGDLKAVKIGRSIRIRPTAIESFLEAIEK
jgi:excisionase family DNA binding protein